MTAFELGTYYKYLIADVTKHPGTTGPLSPVQDHSIPIYLGLGPQVPGETFVHDRHDYRTLRVLGPEDLLNPFPVPLVIAERERG
ncbi:hypothetical protein ELZ19_06935 [Brucella abortus]|uniref:hypothetical protein n=1 Tax=Brucella abortus TaxID=235 RepID=UPI0004E90C47|nr:hypothetical protein [Brucella abortus]KFH18461.1 hypothetical protein IB60_17310 [Brucella abortus LMN1]RUQ67305.1 hypothetical protein ELZ23_15365 [Brucella abortus]RUQ78564.1 hypothetical protein ELZ22_16960 [Brucella abortus]RUQ88306.1 hypothetical protein ELZ18_15715 [Brucella abortus]RUQ90336.1 hypothetical protein ELZ20_15715 [Brucella abortus]